MLHILRKTYFDKPIHVSGVLYLNNFEAYSIWIESNIHVRYYIYVFDIKFKNKFCLKYKTPNSCSRLSK